MQPSKDRIKVLAALPTPPPYSGPEINGQMLLDAGLGAGIELCHVRTNVTDLNSAKGQLSVAKLVSGLNLWLRLLHCMLRCRPRIVYLYLSQNQTGFIRDAAAILTARCLGIKTIAHVRGGNFLNYYTHSPRFGQMLIRFVTRGLAGVVLLGERFRPQFEGLVSAERVFVLHNAVPLAPTRSERLSAGPPRFNALFIGHLSYAKGFVDILAAAPGVLEAVPEASFTFAGEWLGVESNILYDETGRRLHFDAQETRRMLDELQRRFPGRVQLAGVVQGPDKTALFQSADVFVLPSYSEGMPVAVLEAMAAGLPVVVTPVGALPEVLADGAGARFVPTGDPLALTDVLVDLAGQPEQARRMGEANRQLVAQRYAPAPMFARLAEIIRSVAA